MRGTPGHEPPERLRPRKGERIVHKSFHSAFSVPEFDASLNELGVDGMLLAGVHLHACIRATALGAYSRGLEVAIAREACGSDDPAHASVTKAFLEYCGINFWRGVEYEA
ncbi:MAG: cysteine hydrolase [Proteobacteria bacterium]|nr:cysteine hydrolase [Pseudomonadota bacterium]